MSYLNPRVLDHGLEILVRETTHLTISPSQPFDYDSANTLAIGTTWIPQATAALGSKDPTLGLVTGPSNALPNGRSVTVGPIVDGHVMTSGNALHWNLLDDHNKRLLASGALSNPLPVEAGNAFTLTAFNITIPGS